MGLPEIFIRYNPHIKRQIGSLFKDKDLALYDMMKYHLGWMDDKGKPTKSNSGKMLRATLCLLACESTGEGFSRALPAAAAIELIHNYSLVHDDIQDGDEIRRHRKTVWKIWGKPQAINAGSALRMLANLSVLKQDDKEVTPTKKLEVLDIMDESCLEMIEGQYLDIDYEQRADISVEQYLEMINKKTSALIAGSLKAGAVLNLSMDGLDSFAEFGESLGKAFQITDDILGIWGNDKKTGKPLANDIKKKKKSLPIVYCFQKAGPGEKKLLSDIYKKQDISEADVSRILDILEDIKARDYCSELSNNYYRQATSRIEKLPISEKMLPSYLEITDFLINRDF